MDIPFILERKTMHKKRVLWLKEVAVKVVWNINQLNKRYCEKICNLKSNCTALFSVQCKTTLYGLFHHFIYLKQYITGYILWF